jgi:hypothetical protein
MRSDIAPNDVPEAGLRVSTLSLPEPLVREPPTRDDLSHGGTISSVS